MWWLQGVLHVTIMCVYTIKISECSNYSNCELLDASETISFLHCSTSIHVQMSGILFNDHKTWLHNAFHYSCVDISFIRSKIAKGAKHYLLVWFMHVAMLHAHAS